MPARIFCPSFLLSACISFFAGRLFASELYLNCGGADVVDTMGRVWVAAEGFLAVEGGPGGTLVSDQPVDVSGLEDSELPAEVFETARVRAGDIKYRIPVEAGIYRVTIYFSENCPECVSPSLGGSGCPDCLRAVGVAVEDQHIDYFVPADAALPPDGDMQGRVFTATALSLVVYVVDHTLEIRIRDLGEGNPPGDSTVSAIALKALQPFIRGDSNFDGKTDISDAVCVLSYLFAGPGDPCAELVPKCPDAGDANDDGNVDIADAVRILSYLFAGGGALPEPFPDCGEDPTEDELPLCMLAPEGCLPPPPGAPVPCGTEREIFWNDNADPAVVTFEVTAPCAGAVTRFVWGDQTRTVPSGRTEVVTLQVPPYEAVILQCGGGGGGACICRRILELSSEENVSVGPDGVAEVSRAISVTDPSLVDLFHSWQEAYLLSDEAKQSLEDDTGAEILTLLGSTPALIESDVSPHKANAVLAQTARVPEAALYNPDDGTWEVQIGPQNEAALDLASEHILNACIYAALYLDSLPGEQILTRNRTVNFRLPQTSEILNAAELQGASWRVEFGGGTVLRAEVTVNGSELVLREQLVVTEGAPDLLFENEGASVVEAFRSFRIFKVRYTGVAPAGAVKRFKSGGGIPRRPLKFSKTWQWNPSFTFDKTFSDSNWRVRTYTHAQGGFKAHLGWKFKWFKLKWFEGWVSFDPSLQAQLDAFARYAYSGKWSTLICGNLYKDFWFSVFFIPVWIRLQLEPYASAKVGLHARLDVKYRAHFSAHNKLGARWEGGWSWINEHWTNADYDNFEVRTGARADLSLGSWYSQFKQPGIDLTAYVYDVAGPFVRGNPYLYGYMYGSVTSGLWRLKAGFTAWGGVHIRKKLREWLGLGSWGSWEHRFFKWEREIARGEWHIDTTPPQVSVRNAPGDWVNEQVRASVECSDSGSGCDSGAYRLKFYSSNPGSCPCRYDAYDKPSPYSVTSHVWVCAVAKDKVGNVGCSQPVEFKVDMQEPQNPSQVTSPSHQVGRWSSDKTVEVAWSAGSDGGGSGVAGYSIAWDQSNSTVPDATVETGGRSATSPPLGDGVWWFHVRTVDKAGNGAQGASHLGPFKIDTAPPSAPDLLSPPDGRVTNDSTPLFDWSDVGDPSGITYTLVVWQGETPPEEHLKEGVVLRKTGLTESGYQVTAEEAFGDGAYKWRVYAVDGAGNMSPSSIRSFTCDGTPPRAPELVSPSDGALIADTTPFFDWSDVSDPNGVTYTLIVGYGQTPPEERLKNGVVLRKAGLTESHYQVMPKEALADRTYWWRVVAVDGAGNSSAPSARRTFTVDATAPPSPELFSPRNGCFIKDVMPFFDWSDVSDPNGVTYTLVVGRGETPPEQNLKDGVVMRKEGLLESHYQTTPKEVFSEGAYWWRVYSRDGLGNLSRPSSTFTFTVDTQAPVVSILQPEPGANLEAHTPYEISWNIAEETRLARIHLEITAGTDQNQLVLLAVDLPPTQRSYAWEPPGTFERCDLHLTAFDAAGNQGSAESWLSVHLFLVDSLEAAAFNNAPKLVRAPSGTLHLVFAKEGSVFYSRSTDGGINWSAKVRIGAGAYPAVALAPDGTPCAVWIGVAGGPGGAQGAVWFARRNTAGETAGWTTPISILTASDPAPPGFSIDGSGQGHVVAVSGGRRVLYVSFPVTAPLVSLPEQIDEGGCGRAAVAVDPAVGRPHAAWDRDGVIRHAFRGPGGWSQPEVVSEPGSEARAAALYFSQQGLHVVWEQGGEVLYRLLTQSGWQSVENVSRTPDRSTVPVIAGPAVVVWQEEGGDQPAAITWSMRDENSSSWSTPQVVDGALGTVANPHAVLWQTPFSDTPFLRVLWTEGEAPAGSATFFEVKFKVVSITSP